MSDGEDQWLRFKNARGDSVEAQGELPAEDADHVEVLVDVAVASPSCGRLMSLAFIKVAEP